MRHRETD